MISRAEVTCTYNLSKLPGECRVAYYSVMGSAKVVSLSACERVPRQVCNRRAGPPHQSSTALPTYRQTVKPRLNGTNKMGGYWRSERRNWACLVRIKRGTGCRNVSLNPFLLTCILNRLSMWVYIYPQFHWPLAIKLLIYILPRQIPRDPSSNNNHVRL